MDNFNKQMASAVSGILLAMVLLFLVSILLKGLNVRIPFGLPTPQDLAYCAGVLWLISSSKRF